MFCSKKVRFKLTIMIQNIIAYNSCIDARFNGVYTLLFVGADLIVCAFFCYEQFIVKKFVFVLLKN